VLFINKQQHLSTMSVVWSGFKLSVKGAGKRPFVFLCLAALITEIFPFFTVNSRKDSLLGYLFLFLGFFVMGLLLLAVNTLRVCFYKSAEEAAETWTWQLYGFSLAWLASAPPVLFYQGTNYPGGKPAFWYVSFYGTKGIFAMCSCVAAMSIFLFIQWRKGEMAAQTFQAARATKDLAFGAAVGLGMMCSSMFFAIASSGEYFQAPFLMFCAMFFAFGPAMLACISIPATLLPGGALAVVEDGKKTPAFIMLAISAIATSALMGMFMYWSAKWGQEGYCNMEWGSLLWDCGGTVPLWYLLVVILLAPHYFLDKQQRQIQGGHADAAAMPYEPVLEDVAAAQSGVVQGGYGSYTPPE
jgi:hypothetical protein